jgi:hypothetical protein
VVDIETREEPQVYDLRCVGIFPAQIVERGLEGFEIDVIGAGIGRLGEKRIQIMLDTAALTGRTSSLEAITTARVVDQDASHCLRGRSDEVFAPQVADLKSVRDLQDRLMHERRRLKRVPAPLTSQKATRDGAEMIVQLIGDRLHRHDTVPLPRRVSHYKPCLSLTEPRRLATQSKAAQLFDHASISFPTGPPSDCSSSLGGGAATGGAAGAPTIDWL